ncbi:MAG: glycosyltransferase [Planctomycetota bacterium]|nr:glycosyltransferase [Planctomycetota bacterium]
MFSFIIPTHNRPDELARTLHSLRTLFAAAESPAIRAEVIIVDNASIPPAAAPLELAPGVPVRVIHRDENEGAAARNVGADAARGDWLIMLDDDSAPLNRGFAHAIRDASADTVAVAAEITLESGGREAGGLPEVFIGCGVAIRRNAFLAAGGYDPSFHYYAEEYDLAARLIQRGGRITMDRRFRVLHRKVQAGRDMNLIIGRLVRNNAWIIQRYAPRSERRARLRENFLRYLCIARKERAIRGWTAGAAEAIINLRRQPRRTMTTEHFDRFTGLAAARAGLAVAEELDGARTVAIVDRGKNDWCIERALAEAGRTIVEDESRADALIIGTLSPGPMLDAFERRRALGQCVVAPWRPVDRPSPRTATTPALAASA